MLLLPLCHCGWLSNFWFYCKCICFIAARIQVLPIVGFIVFCITLYSIFNLDPACFFRIDVFCRCKFPPPSEVLKLKPLMPFETWAKSWAAPSTERVTSIVYFGSKLDHPSKRGWFKGLWEWMSRCKTYSILGYLHGGIGAIFAKVKQWMFTAVVRVRKNYWKNSKLFFHFHCFSSS